MNLPQRIILIVSVLAILGMALLPPWFYVYDPPEAARRLAIKTERPAGYHLVFGEHVPQDQTELIRLFNLTPESAREWYFASLQFFSLRIDTTRLTVQIGATLLLTLILYLALHRKSSD